MLAAARRLGASIILLAVVYQGRSVLESRGGGLPEAPAAALHSSTASSRVSPSCSSMLRLEEVTEGIDAGI